MSGRTGPPRSGKVDAVQAPIVEALRAAGVFVQSLASVGDGCPDLLCANGLDTVGEMFTDWFLIECKDPDEGLTPKQKEWHRNAPGRAHIAFSPEQAVEIANHYRKRRT